MPTTILITGASGGIGFATAQRFAQAGAKLILHAHQNIDAIKELQHSYQKRGGTADIVSTDFTQTDAAEQLYRQTFELTDNVDVFVNAAGLDLMSPSLVSLSYGQKLQRIFQTDVYTPMMLSRLFCKRMLEQKGGTIFLFGWSGVDSGWPGETAQLYGAAKGALLGFSRALAEDVAARNAGPDVLVRCLALGWIKTRWGVKLREEAEQRYAADSRRNRWGTPKDVAAAIEFLSTPESGYMDGIGLRLDGEKRACNWDLQGTVQK